MAAREVYRRPTIAEIAERTGVSAGAVSYALNGKPGVSDETRARIVAAAREVGWKPSTAARALRGGGTATVGLVITREPETLGIEPFFMAFVAGIESVISQRDYALLLQVTPNPEQVIATYREWWSAGRIDGIFLTDLTEGDERPALLQELGMPAVVVGDPRSAGGHPAVSSDDAGAAEAAVSRLAELGHRRIGHIAGPQRFVHTTVRSAAMHTAAERLGVQIVAEITTNYTLDEGAAACKAMLAKPNAPTAVVCDNDLTAVGAVRGALDDGLVVPDELSVIAWDDSPLCRVTAPAVSALSRDVSAYGAAAAESLLALIRGEDVEAPQWASVARLVDRGSIAHAPR